jgi:cytochrome c biogenesis factor
LPGALLVVAAGAVLLGTLYPLLIDALGMGKLSVGPPYFNRVRAAHAPLLFLIAIGPLALEARRPARHGTAPALGRRAGRRRGRSACPASVNGRR